MVRVAAEGQVNQSIAVAGTSQTQMAPKFVEVSQTPAVLTQAVTASRILKSPPVATLQQGGKVATFTEIKTQPLLLVSTNFLSFFGEEGGKITAVRF